MSSSSPKSGSKKGEVIFEDKKKEKDQIEEVINETEEQIKTLEELEKSVKVGTKPGKGSKIW